MSLDYELSPIGKYRRGTPDDPYMPINQQQKIINQRMQLTEIPVFRDKVRIYGYSEVPQNYSADLAENQYRVDYNNGIVYFHQNAEGKTLTASFLGRGNAYISSNRVWVNQNNGEVTRTLKELIDTGETALDNIQKLNQVIGDAQTATKNANDATKVSTDTNTAIRNEESLRFTEENVRKENEKQRIESEQKRNQAELIRDKDENIRNSLENERKVNEEARKKSEQARETNENERKLEEEKRNSNEIIRQSQEDKRQTDTAHAISEANDARNSANQAANNAQNIADETRHLDEYSPITTYKPNNIVSFDGSSYMNVEESKGIDPSDNTKWKLVGKKGDSINWKRDYSSTTQYQENDTVFFNGSSYIALKDNIGISPTDKSVWDLCAQKGLDGTGAGSVTEVKSVNDDIKVDFESTTPTLTLNSGNGTNQIVKRDINGKIEDVENHVAENVAHGATEDNIPNRIIIRDSNGSAKVSPPTDNEHIARKAEVDKALTDAKEYFNNIALNDVHQEITLKSGIQVINIPEAAPFRLGAISGKTEIRDGIGIVNVTNPYAIATSGNLLPPFMEWEQGIAPGDSCMIDDQYAVTIDAQKVGGSFVRYYVPVSKSSVYTFTVDSQGTNSLAYVYLCKPDKTRIDNVKLKGTVTTTDATAWFEVVLNTLDSTGTSPVIGTAKYRNPMLVPGDKPQPFAPQSRSMWAAECQLAANPVDGSNADVLHVGDDGLPYVFEKCKKVALDGSLNWTLNGTVKSGFKIVTASGLSPAIKTVPQGIIVDYKGIPLNNDLDGVSGWTGGGYWQMGDSAYNNLYLSVSNADSGWGDSYTPTVDEIKAYFLGWKMFNWDGGTGGSVDGKGVYNGKTGEVKAFIKISEVGNANAPSRTTILPTTSYESFTPYRLQYLKAKPTVEPIKNYETGLTLSKGWNMVEVGSGVVIREKANPTVNTSIGYAAINTKGSPNYPNSVPLQHVAKNIQRVYKGASYDENWSVKNGGGNGAYTDIPLQNYDTTAVYHVTYTTLDPTLTAPIIGSKATNLRGTVTDMVSWASDAERRLSVVETQKAEKDSPQWITPTLLNDWKHDITVSYFKDSFGIIHFTGNIKDGVVNKIAFMLPSGYRPKRVTQISTTAYSGNAWVTAAVTVRDSGEVFIDNNVTAIKTVLGGISFLAEQ
ncbi:hypothetical protein [Paenibacillus sp. NAIST15-1]|uniref:hypothetical protein n=1 Tax=Paenibacillus sp. NAIST15-1 TaxID=1605994 RepID=UPI00086EF7A4|nr:hypothetical protein [Paenibacillus sp. NAIST15-1]GAV11277.1 hypothetical protein PBN151_1204 [Paenibacillus sp. NAIST15-1]